MQRRRLSQARDPRRVPGSERRCEIDEVRQGRAHLVKVRVADAPVRLRLRRQHLIPGRLHRQGWEEVARVLQPQRRQVGIELGPAALPYDGVRSLDAAGAVVGLSHVDEVHEAAGPGQTLALRQRREDLAVPPSVRVAERIGHG